MRKTRFMLLVAVLTSSMLRAEAVTYTAKLVCNLGPNSFIPLDLTSFNFSTTQFTDPNTGSLTGKVISSIRFELPFEDNYIALQAAATSKQKFSTCNLYLTRGINPQVTYATWSITDAVVTDLSVEGQEGSSGSTNVVGTMTFAKAELTTP